LKPEHLAILDYLNKHLSVDIKRKFNHTESLELVKIINQLIDNWEDIKIEQNEPDFMKQLKGLQL